MGRVQISEEAALRFVYFCFELNRSFQNKMIIIRRKSCV